MSQKTFDVVFSGELLEGAPLEKVKANVAALFKVEVAKVERLFSGATVAIKTGLDEQTATKYQMVLKKAGAICQVVNRAAAPAVAKPVAAAPTAAKAAPDATGESSAALGLQKSVVKKPPQGVGEFDGANIDAAGTVLVEHQGVPEPQIDTSELSLDQVGAELTEHEEVAVPQVDTSAGTRYRSR
jgi:hypothetical protein